MMMMTMMMMIILFWLIDWLIDTRSLPEIGTGTPTRMRNWYYKPTRYSLLETDNKTSHYQIACQTCETREKPVAVFWYRNLAPIAGACVTGVRFSQTVKCQG